MSSQSSWWMDTAECQGVVGQIILNDSMVVRTCRWLTKRLSAKGGKGAKCWQTVQDELRSFPNTCL